MKITDVHYYDDIINLPHHVSPKRAKMSLKDRGAQFGSFEALSGHSDAVSETTRLTYEKIELYIQKLLICLGKPMMGILLVVHRKAIVFLKVRRTVPY